jgi:hypothetical protein
LNETMAISRLLTAAESPGHASDAGHHQGGSLTDTPV